MASIWATPPSHPTTKQSSPSPSAALAAPLSSSSSSSSSDSTSEMAAPPAPKPPAPILQNPVLFISGITENVPDAALVGALSECLRLRPRISRETGSAYAEARGLIEFESIYKAEKAYATCNGHGFPDYRCSLNLHFDPPSSSSTSSDPSPSAAPRLIKNLSIATTPGQLFDLCREWGAIYRIVFLSSPAFPLGSGPDAFNGQAIVHYYEDGHARRAVDELHFLEFLGSTITIQLYDPGRAKASSWADAPAFVPSAGGLSPSASAWSPQTASRSFSGSSSASGFNPAPPASVAGSVTSWGTATKASAAAIDPCNLFIKSLDPAITSQDLHSLFSRFGTIVSARVMRDERSSHSREFGFVSFQLPEEARQALWEMDGKRLGMRNIVVRLHEPKKVREERIMKERMMRNNSLSDDYGPRLHNAERSSLSPSPSRSRSPSAPFTRELSSPTSTSASIVEHTQDDITSCPPETSRTPLSERERLREAVDRLVTEHELADPVLDLLLGLPKKERALCLFNPEHLRAKIEDAKHVVLASAENDVEEQDRKESRKTAAVLSLPTPQTSPTLTRSPAVPTPSSLADLGALPAAAIWALLQDPSRPLFTSFGIQRVEKEKEDSLDAFMDGLEGRSAQEKKQKLGERLFKVLKSTGVKGAPKITIQLLDSEELVPLAHLLRYPTVLKEKALHAAMASK